MGAGCMNYRASFLELNFRSAFYQMWDSKEFLYLVCLSFHIHKMERRVQSSAASRCDGHSTFHLLSGKHTKLNSMQNMLSGQLERESCCLCKEGGAEGVTPH